MTATSVEFRNLSKNFGPVNALVDFSHAFAAGEIHALMGRNGSGKSTAIKILGGVLQPSSGEVHVGGNPVHFANPKDAQAAGIATVYQELSMVPGLTVAENLFLGDLGAVRGKAGLIDWGRVNRLAQDHLYRIGVDLDPRCEVSRLSVGQQQILEIAKAMRSDPSILIFDEATSALANREVEQVFKLMRDLKARGVTMLYVTHRMSEIFEIADTCTVLRDGRFVSEGRMSALSHRMIVDQMFGDAEIARKPARPNLTEAPAVLSVKGLSRSPQFEDVSFSVRRGEILGIAGILGSGRTEILRGIFGADPTDAGTVTIDGTTVRPKSPLQMKALGFGLTPENRKEVGLVQAQSSHSNLCMASLRKLASRAIITREMERPAVDQQIRDLAIKTGDPDSPVSTLSGGNQQKIVVGKWLSYGPKVLLLDEPTRGIDLQAKRQLFDIIWQKAEAGLSIIFVSSELEEILEVTDRVIMLRHGRIVAEAQTQDVSLQDLYDICLGE
ncbi:MAG: sugar ABC transporter ATP-binding protein [Pseudomonadota bacterium]